MSKHWRRRLGLLVAVSTMILVAWGLLAWYSWPSATVESVQKQLARELPIGTPRAQAEAWLRDNQIEHSEYNSDYSFTSVIRDRGIKPGDYRGYIAALIRDTDRGLFVTGSIQFYLLFDEQDRVAKHVVSWEGTGP